MLKKKLFGRNIKPSCSYCQNAVFENNAGHCSKGKNIIKDKCKSFKYDPLMRVPKSEPTLHEYTLDDFKL